MSTGFGVLSLIILPVCLSCIELAPDLDLYMLIYLHVSIRLGISHLACLKEKPVFLLIVHTYIYIQTSAIKTLFFIAVTEHIILAVLLPGVLSH